MPFPYYRRLSARNQAIYRASDGVTEVPLGDTARFGPLVETLRGALERDSPRDVQSAAEHLCRALTSVLGIEPVVVKVLSRRPSDASGELHGLYVRETGKPAVIRIWFRTAQQRRVVAFRTFLRTLLHEVGHHLDFTLYRWPETFHTEGFFRRESSLLRQLLPGETGRSRRKPETPAPDAPPARRRKFPRPAPAPVEPPQPEVPRTRAKPETKTERSAPVPPSPPRRTKPKAPEQMSLFDDDPPGGDAAESDETPAAEPSPLRRRSPRAGGR